MRFLGLVAQAVDRTLDDRIQPLERVLDSFSRADEERVDEVCDVQPCLADELAESRRPAETSEAMTANPRTWI